MTFNINDGGIDPNKRYCLICKRKNPPVMTVLVLGENINEYRWKTKTHYCNDCNSIKQKHHNKQRRIRNPKIERIKIEDQIIKFEQEWNDPEFKNKKELADKLVNVLIKYGRRDPEHGLYKEVMCQVMFPDYWFVSVNQVVEDMLKTKNAPPSVKANDRDTLYQYIPAVMEAFKKYYRRKAINKFDGLVVALNHKFSETEHLCAQPSFKDPKTLIEERRWYLLSYKPELDERTESKKNQKIRIDYNIDRESQIVKQHEEKRSTEQFEETNKNREKDSDVQHQQDNDDNNNQGGE